MDTIPLAPATGASRVEAPSGELAGEGVEPSRAIESGPTQTRTLSKRRVLVSTILALAVLVAGMAGLAYLFKPWMGRLGRAFVEHLGAPGVALAYGVPDAFTVPIPADVVAAFALFGGMPFASVCSWGAAGSLIGGSVGWAVGHFAAGRVPALRARIEADTRVVPFLRRRRAAVLAAAALTPLPYSIACWGAGALAMPFRAFFTVSLLRVPRVVGYLFLVQQGVVAVGGF